jgi:type II secretory pathway pseudopilin PulG
MRTGATYRGHRSRARRGISFLEVVFATVILALTVATMAATVNAISGQQGRSRDLLNCAELANRLVIQYLDDRKALPSEDLTLPYGDDEFRWKMSVTRVESTLDPTVERNLEEFQNRQSGASPDRLKKVVITVWLSEKSGGSYLANQGAPQSTLVRVVDPYAFMRRSPDSLQNLMENGTDELLNQLLGNDIEADEEEEL